MYKTTKLGEKYMIVQKQFFLRTLPRLEKDLQSWGKQFTNQDADMGFLLFPNTL